MRSTSIAELGIGMLISWTVARSPTAWFYWLNVGTFWIYGNGVPWRSPCVSTTLRRIGFDAISSWTETWLGASQTTMSKKGAHCSRALILKLASKTFCVYDPAEFTTAQIWNHNFRWMLIISALKYQPTFSIIIKVEITSIKQRRETTKKRWSFISRLVRRVQSCWDIDILLSITQYIPTLNPMEILGCRK